MERELTEQEVHMNPKTHQGLPSSEEANPTSSFPESCVPPLPPHLPLMGSIWKHLPN